MKAKLRTLVFFLVLALSLSCLTASPARADEEEEQRIIRSARNGVVRVIAVTETGSSTFVGSGTAFGVGKAGEDTDTFVTNWHVVTEDGKVAQKIYLLLDTEAFAFEQTYDSNGNVIAARFLLSDNFDRMAVPCEVLDTTTGYPDVAVIRATKPVSGIKALPLLSSESVKELNTVYALGFPAAGDFDATSWNGNVKTTRYISDAQQVLPTKGSVSRKTPLAFAENTNGIMHNAHINHGNSGGPLLNKDGAVVGINTYGNIEDDSYCYAIYIDYAMDMLDGLGISYDIYEPKKTPEPEPTTEPEPVKKPDKTDDDDDKDGFPVVPVVLICAVAVVAVAAIIALSKRKAAVPEPARQPVTVQGGMSPSATLVCIEGELAGASWPIDARALTIGREVDCQVRFSPNAEGVSRHHCTVAFINGEVAVVDRSKHGVFVGGQRVAADTPIKLRPGEVFTLAGNNSFTVR